MLRLKKETNQKDRIKELETQLEIQMDNNKVLNKRNQNLQKEVVEYQKIIQVPGCLFLRRFHASHFSYYIYSDKALYNGSF